MRAHFVFDDRWVIPVGVDRVRATLLDLEHYPEWWPQVLAVASLGPDDAWVVCRSRLPYALDLCMHARSRGPKSLEVDLTGDLVGEVVWTLHAVGPRRTEIQLHQEVEVNGALAAASLVARPLLRWNHAQMLASGRAGLCRWLGHQPGRRMDSS